MNPRLRTFFLTADVTRQVARLTPRAAFMLVGLFVLLVLLAVLHLRAGGARGH